MTLVNPNHQVGDSNHVPDHDAIAGIINNLYGDGGGAQATALGSIAIGKDSAGTVASSATQDLIAIGTTLSTVQTGKIALSNATTGTVAPAAGAAGALPTAPAGYLTVSINGVARQIPYY